MQTSVLPRRFDGIDLLRSLAIFLVLLNHVNIRLRMAKVPYLQHLPDRLGHAIAWNGQYGVQIFFALSGFLIMSTSLRRWGPPAKFHPLDFYRMRFARIVPLLLTLLAILSALHFLQLPDFQIKPKFGGLLPPLFAALTFRINIFEAAHGYLPGNWDILWSLSVEEIFYLAFPIICLLTRRKSILTAALLLVVAQGPYVRNVYLHGDGLWGEYSYSGGMEAIALGCLTALYARKIPTAIGYLGAAAVAFILIFSKEVQKLGMERTGFDMTILALGTCAVILATANWQAPRLLKPLLTPGRRSYEIYLTHMFVVFACFHVFLDAGKPLLAVPVFFLAVIVLSTALGEIIGRYFSEPANQRLRSRFSTPIATSAA